MAKHKVLIVEDDNDLASLVNYNLQQAGYETYVARDGQDGLNQAFLHVPDVVILDVMLPVVDGIEVCRKLRANPSTQSSLILMLTAKSEDSDQLVGFSVGADDYVVKPYSVKVLLERIKALRRRLKSRLETEDQVITQGIVIDRVKHLVTINECQVDLTPSEFRLLDTLVRQPGRAFDRSELIDTALGEDAVVTERTIDVHIRALRRKMGDRAERIQTVRGVGYRFSERPG